MAHMIPVADYFVAYHVETECGTEIVPESMCGRVTIEDDWPRRAETPGALEPYLEGSRIEGVERKEGWYARLSAPGYLDCTSWEGPYDTEEEALASVKETFDVDDEGDEASEEESECAP